MHSGVCCPNLAPATIVGSSDGGGKWERQSYKTKGSGATHLGRCGSSAKGLRSCSDDATAALGAVDHRGPGGVDPPLEALGAADPPLLDLGGIISHRGYGSGDAMSMALGAVDLPLPASEGWICR